MSSHRKLMESSSSSEKPKRRKSKCRRRYKSRTSYSLAYKLKAVAEAELSGLKAAAASLHLDENLLRSWLSKAQELRQAGLTNAGTSRRIRSKSTAVDEVYTRVSMHLLLFLAFFSNTKTVCQDSAAALPAGTNRSVTLLAVTPPSAGLLVNGVHNPSMLSAVSSPTDGSSPCSSASCSSSLVVSRADACVGTCSASTMTEPECLGPCEPGTAVTLEGIVWHETEGGTVQSNQSSQNVC